ncbi:MAG: hypothetical protein HN368_07085, partial [Spirochaetales bacterium]|nr:hypothetical protein [Spirochaetales bacterium]
MKFRDVPKSPASKNIANYYAGKDSENGPIAAECHLVIENNEGEIVGDIGTSECYPRSGTFTLGLEIRNDQQASTSALFSAVLFLHRVWVL